MNSLYNTCIDEQDEKQIVGWVREYANDSGVTQPQRYLTVTEDLHCELNGCRKYDVVWLGGYSMIKRTVYIDAHTHGIVYTER